MMDWCDGCCGLSDIIGGDTKREKKLRKKKKKYIPREKIDVDVIVDFWKRCSNSRTNVFSAKGLEELLGQLAKNTDKHEDCVSDEGSSCILWKGPFDKLGMPIIKAEASPFEDTENDVTDFEVLRLLVFAFAQDDAYRELGKVDLIQTYCKDKACVRLTHIVVP